MAGKLAGFYEVIKKSRVSLISAVAVVFFFALVPQAQDVIRAMAQPGGGRQIVCFEGILLIWSIIVWYGARFLLDQDFSPMQENMASESVRFSLWGEKFIPRFLGAICFIGTGAAMIIAVWPVRETAGMRYRLIVWIGAINIVLGFIFYLLFKYRRQALTKFSGLLTQRVKSEKMRQVFSFNQPYNRLSAYNLFPGWLRRLLRVCIIISLLFWIFIFFSLQTSAPWLGTSTIFVLAFVFLTIFATALTWLSERYKLPFMFFVLLLSGIAGFFNDNHEVRKKENLVDITSSMTANDLYASWLAKMEEKYGDLKPHPMFIIAASGGGIKAAYWTASILADLQDKNSSFAEHVIIISPVSGGTLGSLVFENLIINRINHNESYLKLARALLSKDFLSPVSASLLFHDLPARLFPFPDVFPDRAEALEVAWERAWNPELNDNLPTYSLEDNVFEKDFNALTEFEKNHAIPTLLINGTSVETGQRILTTHLQLGEDFKDCLNLFAIRRNDIRMSTAAMMSARFTYVSPAGTIRPDTHVVDGGYYENSGATTAMQFYDSIKNTIDFQKVIPVFIQIDNDYVETSDLGREEREKQEAAERWRVFPELSAPILALLNTRNAHAVSISERVRRTFNEGQYFHYTFDTPGDVKAPLGWFLSKAAQAELDTQLAKKDNHELTVKISKLLGGYNRLQR